jgi:hypothetical protein
MLQKPQKLQLQATVLTADLRDLSAECSQNSSNSSDSEWLLAFSD